MKERYVRPSHQEWLETDGLGGFASSTTLGIHTRKYHGWLFLAGPQPGDRYLALSKLEEVCESPWGVFELSSNYYPGTIHPGGIRHLSWFRRYPFPTFVYQVGPCLLERELFMVRGIRGVFCIYRVLGLSGERSSDLVLRVRPLCNDRFYHHVTREGSWFPALHAVDRGVVIEGHSACGSLALVSSHGTFEESPVWYRNMLYPVERERGLDYSEDHFSPGQFNVKLGPGQDAVFWCGPLQDDTRQRVLGDLRNYALEQRSREISRRESILEHMDQMYPGFPEPELFLSSDQFVVKCAGGTSIIAGYHWFGEWGRDAFVSLPGLLLVPRRYQEAKDVFLRFAGAAKDGLVPNIFAGDSEAHYNSADASLWMIRALEQYYRASGDWEFVSALVPVAKSIVDSYMKGTSFGIWMDPSGLLHSGDSRTQVTWMDACVGGQPVTSRSGYPVEINALWIRVLMYVSRWLRKCNHPDHGVYRCVAEKALGEFIARFVWPGVGMYDRLDKRGPVREKRPNQVIAASVLGTLLPRNVLSDVWVTSISALLTPCGLRTLSPGSPSYIGVYRGTPAERDRAYHQGTAWPWLMGPLFDLAGYVYSGTDQDVLEKLTRILLSRLLDLENNPCIGTVFEVASGDPPHEPGGAVAQAWSVAELVRILAAGSRRRNLHFSKKGVSTDEDSDAGVGIPS